jgi:hypothetical protein
MLVLTAPVAAADVASRGLVLVLTLRADAWSGALLDALTLVTPPEPANRDPEGVLLRGWNDRRGSWRVRFSTTSAGATAVLTLPALPGAAITGTEPLRLVVASVAFACVDGPTVAFDFSIEPSAYDPLDRAVSSSTTAAATAALASLAGGGAAAADSQSLALLGVVNCARRAAKRAAGPLLWLLSPMQVVFGDDESSALVGNIVLLCIVIAVQGVATVAIKVHHHRRFVRDGLPASPAKRYPWRDACATARFPSTTFAAAAFLHQGTSVYALAELFSGHVTAEVLIGLVVVAALPITAWRVAAFTSPSFSPGPDKMIFFRFVHIFDRWPPERAMLLRRAFAAIVPVGKWGPRRPAQQYGSLVRRIRPAWVHPFVLLSTLQPLALAAIAALPVAPRRAEYCAAQLVVMGVVGWLFAAATTFAAPFRSRFENLLPLFGASIASASFFVAAHMTLSSGAGLAPAPAALNALAALSALQSALSVLRALVSASVLFMATAMWRGDGATIPFLESDGTTPSGYATRHRDFHVDHDAALLDEVSFHGTAPQQGRQGPASNNSKSIAPFEITQSLPTGEADLL